MPAREFLKEELEGKKLLGMVPKDRIAKVKIERPSKKTIEELLTLEDIASTVSDILDEKGFTKNVIPASILEPMREGQKIVGPAITVRNIPDPNDVGIAWSRKLSVRYGGDREAYQLAEPGDVIVYDSGGYNISNMGGLSASIAVAKGIAGAIVDGAVRDIATIRKVGYPVWCRGRTPISGKFRYESVAINAAVNCAGVKVEPGDLIVAEDSGVAVVPRMMIEEVLERAKRVTNIEDELRKALKESGYDIKEIMRLTTKRYGLAYTRKV
jgi:regulator of RNase E activity RraA